MEKRSKKTRRRRASKRKTQPEKIPFTVWFAIKARKRILRREQEAELKEFFLHNKLKLKETAETYDSFLAKY